MLHFIVAGPFLSVKGTASSLPKNELASLWSIPLSLPVQEATSLGNPKALASSPLQDVYVFKYVVSEAAKKASKSNNGSKDKDKDKDKEASKEHEMNKAIRDLKISWISKSVANLERDRHSSMVAACKMLRC